MGPSFYNENPNIALPCGLVIVPTASHVFLLVFAVQNSSSSIVTPTTNGVAKAIMQNDNPKNYKMI